MNAPTKTRKRATNGQNLRATELWTESGRPWLPLELREAAMTLAAIEAEAEPQPNECCGTIGRHVRGCLGQPVRVIR